MKRRPGAVLAAASLLTALLTATSLLTAFSSPALAQPEIWGFAEYAAGIRAADTPDGLPETMLNEARVQLQGEAYGDAGEAHFAVDFLADRVTDTEDVVLREGWVKVDLGASVELRAGRQPATWGTGDLLFINDLFPKDYVSFFTGREDAYLKSPVDAVRLNVFAGPWQLDVVASPEFSPDLTPTGARLDFFALAAVPVRRPDGSAGDGEIAARLRRTFGSWEAAAYGYRGFWKAPVGLARDDAGQPAAAVHPRLTTAGASLRGPLRGGVAWVEGGWWNSTEDADGTDPDVPNSELQALAGYERSLWSDFTAGVQGYVRHVRDLPAGADAERWLTTLRVRQLLRRQTVDVSGFLFLSPTDDDAYVRLAVSYDVDDAVRVTLGGNLFTGDADTPFGSNDANDSVYLRTRMSF